MRPELMMVAAAVMVAAFILISRANRTSSEDAHRLVQEEGARLVDVRTSVEFSQGHLPGAKNLPVSDLAGLAKALGDDKDAPVVLYCRSGARSGRAKRFLEKEGFTAVYDLGPMSAW